MSRKRFGYRALFEIAARQAEYWPPSPERPLGEIGIACSICGEPIRPGQKVTLDHGDAVGFGTGRDIPDNCDFVHEDPCHKDKTAKDKARIAKAKRQAGETGQRARRERNGPAMESRGFDTRWRKRMDGTVWRREDA